MDQLQQAIEPKCRTAAAFPGIGGIDSGLEILPSTAVEQASLPSFFVVGPPRTGTSWLHDALAPHVSLPTPSKETRFFDTHFQRGLPWYVEHYQSPAEDKRIGEVAPTYFASAEARERMSQTVPTAKIVCVFRNPVERVVSLYRLKRAYGLIPWNLEEALERDPELMESSRYAANLKAWREAFGAERVFAAIYDDLQQNAQGFIDSIADFIGVPRFLLARAHGDRVHDSERMTLPRNYYSTRAAMLAADWLKARRLDGVVMAFKRSRLRKLVLGGGQPFGRVPLPLQLRLYEKLRPEIDELEQLIERNLSAWRRPGMARI
jgi:Sulfotransferase domain